MTPSETVEIPLELARDGAALHSGRAVPILPILENSLATVDGAAAGIRLSGPAIAALRPLLATQGAIGAVAAEALGLEARPVRAILFDKNPATNWNLGWHQDRVICVRERRDVPGFHAWTVKMGQLHVAPPFAVLAEMVTLRMHLDCVTADNAPLRIAPGSHQLGRIAEEDIAATVAQCGKRICLAEAGDVWVYATPILHASAPSANPKRRRVLQIDYAAKDLPGGLEWAGV